MKPVKKILVVHGEAKARRRLVLTLADSGFDVRAFGAMSEALESAGLEWFDLAILADGNGGVSGFGLADALRKTQPTVPVILLVPTIELPVIVRGIRAGLADVMADEADVRGLLKRVHGLLRPSANGADDELTPRDLAEVEDVLARISKGAAVESAESSTGDLREELFRSSQERAGLEKHIDRLTHEKAALEAELRTLLAQHADSQRLQADLSDLHTQQELAAATQTAIDAKAGQLTELRAEIVRERTALDAAQRELAAGRGRVSEKASLETLREELRAEQERLRDDAARVRQEAAQIAQERRRWHEDLDLLVAQEDNLRAYETRLRQLQGQLESDRVLWFQGKTEASASPFRDDTELRAAWEKIQRATELLESDRAVLRDERMTLRDQEAMVLRREKALSGLEAKQAEVEQRLRDLPPPAALTRSPFSIWGKTRS